MLLEYGGYDTNTETAEALCNILDNAVKYTPACGSIHVTVQEWEMYVKVDIADTGKGIPEKEQAAIFIVLYVIFSQLASYAVFSYPLIPLVLVSGMVLLICVIVPIWTYKTDIKLPVVERLRISEKG